MTGSKPKGQHFVPRFLLDGFASRRHRKESYAYLFRRGAPCHEVNIRDVGKSRYFHGDPCSSQLEAKLSSVENRLAELVRRLISTGATLPEDSLPIAQLVTSCLVRTRNLRDAFGNTLRDMFTALEERVSDLSVRMLQGYAVEGLLSAIREHPKTAREFFGLPRSQRERPMSVFVSQAASPDTREVISDHLQMITRTVKLEKISIDSHRASLSKYAEFSDSDPESRVAIAKQLEWSVRFADNVPYILGDMVVAGLGSGRSTLQNPLVFDWPPDALCIPLSAQALLVGVRRGYDLRLDVEAVNLAAVELSRDFFVSSTATEREAAYADRIGVRAELMSRAELAAMFRDPVSR